MDSVKHSPLVLGPLQMLDQKKRRACQKQVGMCLVTMGLLFFEGLGEEAVKPT